MLFMDCSICERQLECQLAGRQICPIDLLKREGSDNTSTINDSGNRTEFSTGAVRDLHEGKGRFDLLPMCVLLRLAKHYEKGAQKYEERNWEKGIPAHSFADSAFRHLVKYMDGYTDEDHLIAAIWNLCGLAWTEEKRPELMDIPSRPFGSITLGQEGGDLESATLKISNINAST